MNIHQSCLFQHWFPRLPGHMTKTLLQLMTPSWLVSAAADVLVGGGREHVPVGRRRFQPLGFQDVELLKLKFKAAYRSFFFSLWWATGI